MRMTKPASVAALAFVALGAAAGISWWFTGNETLFLVFFVACLACIVVPLFAMDAYVWKMKARMFYTLANKKEFEKLAESTSGMTFAHKKARMYHVGTGFVAAGVVLMILGARFDSVETFVVGIGAACNGVGALLNTRTLRPSDFDPAHTKKGLARMRILLIIGMFVVAWAVYVERDFKALAMPYAVLGFCLLLFGLGKTVYAAFRRS